jgi:uncharacterized UPF0160 family protein
MKIITHSGNFHPDEVLGVASLLLIYPEAKVCRTRDEKTISEKENEDIVLDVGNIYDVSALRFDHHQEGGAGARENGLPYASFGLVWKHFGAQITGSEQAASTIEEKLVWPIDAVDNGIDSYKRFRTDLKPYLIDGALISFMPTWEEKDTLPMDDAFMNAVLFAQTILKREIVKANSFIAGEGKVIEAYKKAEDKRIIIIDNKYSWNHIISKYPEPLFVVLNDGMQTTWAVSAVKKDSGMFQYRKLFPKEWGGKKGSELATITGVPDAFFCHNGRQLVIANSKEGALRLSLLALEDN